MGRPLAPRQGSALSEVWLPHIVRLAHTINRGGVAGRTQARRGGKRKTRSG